MRLDDLTFDLVQARFLGKLNEENTPRSHMITAVYLLATRKNSDISLRSILKAAGYAASKFYRYWPSRSNFILDAYLYCVQKYIESEASFAHDFSGNCPREFLEFIAKHTVYSQKHIHRDFFREIAGQIAGGDYSRLLVYMEPQVRGNMDIFVDKFPDYKGYIDFNVGMPMIWAVGVFILTRNYDKGLAIIDDNKLVALIADAYSCLVTRSIAMSINAKP